uniref:CCHC-type domain-containing protein n=1 Tax=Lygus hesperus TaxID=30085 RepID=A0A146L485_LYGHE
MRFGSDEGMSSSRKVDGIVCRTMRKIESMVGLTVKQYVDTGNLFLDRMSSGDSQLSSSVPNEMGSIVTVLAEALNLALRLEVAANSRTLRMDTIQVNQSAREPRYRRWSSRWSPRYWKEANQDAVCWNCHETGHMIRTCPKRIGSQGTPRFGKWQDYTCWECGKSGHRRSNCRSGGRGNTNSGRGDLTGDERKVDELGRPNEEQGMEGISEQTENEMIGGHSTGIDQENEVEGKRCEKYTGQQKNDAGQVEKKRQLEKKQKMGKADEFGKSDKMQCQVEDRRQDVGVVNLEKSGENGTGRLQMKIQLPEVEQVASTFLAVERPQLEAISTNQEGVKLNPALCTQPTNDCGKFEESEYIKHMKVNNPKRYKQLMDQRKWYIDDSGKVVKKTFVV